MFSSVTQPSPVSPATIVRANTPNSAEEENGAYSVGVCVCVCECVDKALKRYYVNRNRTNIRRAMLMPVCSVSETEWIAWEYE